MRLYSHSQLATFEACPQQYKFRYIDKIKKPEEQSIEAFVGSCVHEVLKRLYDELVLSKLNTLDDLLAYYRAVWERDYQPTFLIVRKELTAQNFFDYGAQCLRNYYARYHPFNQGQTLDTEPRIVFALDARGEYKLQGYIDRIARRPDGTYEIHDYKTGGHVPAQKDVDSDRQLGLYQIGLMSRWPDVERVDLLWHYVGRDTTLRSTRTSEQLKELAAETVAAIDRIEREQEYEPNKDAPCDWCEYRPDCPLWKHVAAVESLPPAEFAADAGVQFANQYAQTKFEIERLEARLQHIREQILEFCRQKQATVLAGSGVRVAVKVEEKTRFPHKGDPLRGPLEELVKRVGRWDEVSDLSLGQLVKVVEEEAWPPELLEQLRQFATTEETATVRVTPTKPPEANE
jgi:putative RecB family exonuclease